MIWELWKERNQRISKDKELEVERILNKIEVAIVEVVNSRNLNFFREDCSFLEWDNQMRKNWQGLRIPPFFGKGNGDNQEKRNQFLWSLPKTCWYELNFDGSYYGNLRMLGVGYIIH